MSVPVEDIRGPQKDAQQFFQDVSLICIIYNIYTYSLIVFPLISRFPFFEVSLCKSRKGVLEMGDPQSSWSNDWMIFGGTPETRKNAQ